MKLSEIAKSMIIAGFIVSVEIFGGCGDETASDSASEKIIFTKSLVAGENGKGCLLTLTDRKSRFQIKKQFRCKQSYDRGTKGAIAFFRYS